MLYELLIYGKDNFHQDPLKEVRGCYKAGDIVLFKKSPAIWGAAECLPIFYVFKVELTEKEAEDLIKPQYEKEDDPSSGILKRRRFKFDFSDPVKLPPSELDKIKTESWYLPTILKAEITDKAL